MHLLLARKVQDGVVEWQLHLMLNGVQLRATGEASLSLRKGRIELGLTTVGYPS